MTAGLSSRGQGRGSANLPLKRLSSRLAAPVALMIFACARDAPPEWLGTIDTLPSGIIHVSNPEQGLWGDRAPWQLVEVARIGARDGSGPEVFGAVWDIDVDQMGRVYVLDWQAQQVRLFDADGSYVRTLGGPGGGPGEFRIVNGIAVDSANRLWVNNQGNMRLSVFDTAGVLAVELRKALTGMQFVYWLRVFSVDGHLMEHGGYRTAEGQFVGLRRYDVATESLVDVNVTRSHPAPPGTRPFSKTFTLTPKGTWGGDKYIYRLWHTTLSGDTTRIMQRSREADRLSAVERDSAKRMERDINRRSVQGAIDVETEVRPYFERLVLDDLDHLWVILTREPDDTITQFDVFDPLGRYLGMLAAPHVVEQEPQPVVRNGTIYYVTKDELDVQYVVVAEVRGR